MIPARSEFQIAPGVPGAAEMAGGGERKPSRPRLLWRLHPLDDVQPDTTQGHTQDRMNLEKETRPRPATPRPHVGCARSQTSGTLPKPNNFSMRLKT